MKIRLKRHNLLAISALALTVSMPAATAFAQDAASAAQTSGTETVTPWGHKSADVPSDPSIRYGALENGMKYALRRNETPKDSASVRMYIDVGSIAEAENERGLAHLLEHLAFNGSTNVPEGEMVKILERKGLSFGADTNASTGFEATTYMLELPKTNDDLVDTALFLMRETAGELTISDEAVSRERGVVLSEKQTRNSPGLRRAEHYLQFAMPDAPFGNRLPIGTEEVLKNAPAARIKDFYRRYYRPENTTLVLVGDFDVDAMETKVKAKFAGWTNKTPAGKPMDRGKLDSARPFSVGAFSDPALSTEVELGILTPYTRQDDSIAERKKSMLEGIASGIMANRFQKLSLATDAKIRGGSIEIGDIFNAFNQSAVSVNANGDDWQSALSIGEQELRKAMTYGFTQAEVDEQLANFETGARNDVQQADTRRSPALAGSILSTLIKKSIVTTPQTRLAIFEKLKGEMTVDAVTGAFRKAFSAPPSILHLTTKAPIENPQAAAFAVLGESNKVAVAAPEKIVNKAFAYDSFGTPGKVAEDKRIEDLGIRTLRFANNVRLNIKKTDFEKGRVRFNLRFGGGELTIPQGKAGLNFYMQSMTPVMSLKAHDVEELQRILAGKTVSLGFGYGGDSFGSGGTTTPEHAELQMKLLAAFMTDLGYRPEADTVWQNQIKAFLPQLTAQPQSVANFAVPRILASGDTRFGLAEGRELTDRNLEDVRAALAAQVTDSPIEIAIVGDIEEQATIDIVAKSFGALPKRQAASPDYKAARQVKFTDKRGLLTLKHKGKDDQGMVLAYWPTTDSKDFKSTTIRDLTSEVFGSLLLDEVREKLGATYSPGTRSVSSDNYDGYGYFSTSIVAEPAKMDIVSKAIKDITKQMRDAPVSDDVLLRARKPLLENFGKRERENSAWIGIVDEAQTDLKAMQEWRTIKAMFESITTADIQKAAQQYMADKDQLEIRIVSETLAK
jgi:zinc protease